MPVELTLGRLTGRPATDVKSASRPEPDADTTLGGEYGSPLSDLVRSGQGVLSAVGGMLRARRTATEPVESTVMLAFNLLPSESEDKTPGRVPEARLRLIEYWRRSRIETPAAMVDINQFAPASTRDNELAAQAPAAAAGALVPILATDESSGARVPAASAPAPAATSALDLLMTRVGRRSGSQAPPEPPEKKEPARAASAPEAQSATDSAPRSVFAGLADVVADPPRPEAVTASGVPAKSAASPQPSEIVRPDKGVDRENGRGLRTTFGSTQGVKPEVKGTPARTGERESSKPPVQDSKTTAPATAPPAPSTGSDSAPRSNAGSDIWRSAVARWFDGKTPSQPDPASAPAQVVDISASSQRGQHALGDLERLLRGVERRRRELQSQSVA
jgi:hypothetical protein